MNARGQQRRMLEALSPKHARIAVMLMAGARWSDIVIEAKTTPYEIARVNLFVASAKRRKADNDDRSRRAGRVLPSGATLP